MRETLITRHDDCDAIGDYDSIAWAYEAHLKVPDPGTYNAAIVYGNEDCPDMIDFYVESEPLITSKIALRWRNIDKVK